jgi:hypothetical protein
MGKIGLVLFLITVMFTGRVVSIPLRTTWRGQGMYRRIRIGLIELRLLLLGACGISISICFYLLLYAFLYIVEFCFQQSVYCFFFSLTFTF